LTDTISAGVPHLNDYPSEPASYALHGVEREWKESPFDVSVVTVVRNNARTLARAAESVFTQDVPDVEYVVVDGGSTDDTLDVIRSLQPRVGIWVSEPDRGISDAFNKGIALSRGEIIGILNSDDWYEPGAVAAALVALKTSGADIAYGPMQYWSGTERTFFVHGDHHQLDRGMSIGHPTIFVRRSAYGQLGLFRLDYRFAMDYEWLLRAKVGGAKFVDVGRCLANMQEGGIGDRKWRRSQREVARARAMHLGHSQLHERASYSWAIAKGLVRRGLDNAGLGVARRLYHRHLSPTRVERARR
jgi:glycosyltransferase involved in cell wall biosynthesis